MLRISVFAIAIISAIGFTICDSQELDAKCGSGSSGRTGLLNRVFPGRQARVEARRNGGQSSYQSQSYQSYQRSSAVPMMLPIGPPTVAGCPYPNCPGNLSTLPTPMTAPAKKSTADEFGSPSPIPEEAAPAPKKTSRLLNGGRTLIDGDGVAWTKRSVYVQGNTIAMNYVPSTIMRSRSQSSCPGGVCPTR